MKQQMVCLTHGPVSDFYPLLALLSGAAGVGGLANQISKGHPIITLAGGLAGLWLGAQGAKRCPQCGELLQVIDIIEPFFG